MAGSEDDKSKKIPEWQNNQLPQDSRKAGGSSTSKTTPKPSLLEKAAEFLRDDEIRNASTERKRIFLTSKGLSEHQIEQLLSNVTDEESHDTSGEGEDTGKSLTADSSSAKDSLSQKSPTPVNAEDSPPIITYPEFLVRSQKPPPLITAQRLLTASYTMLGAAAMLYGTTKYLVEPMLESLHSARHSLFETTSLNVNNLNAKLVSNVSCIPRKSGTGTDDDDDVDAESLDSDPAHFFSRTVGTQTSLPSSQSHSDASPPPPATSVPIDVQASQLSRLHASLQATKYNEGSDQAVQESLDDLRGYLEKLQYTGTWVEPSNDDGIAKVKGDIRAVKGVLLSARNFPSSFVR